MHRALARAIGISVVFVTLCCLLQLDGRASPGALQQLHDGALLRLAQAKLHPQGAHHIDCADPATSPTHDNIVDYHRLVHCSSLRHSVIGARIVLALALVFLLYLLSSTADSFFCPALQAIVETYRVPPDIAGVTFLSFGNGSPDVFSNIAAFSTSTPKIGIASILGGGLLVTTGASLER
ncbi:hypothetical protein PINS_up001635 [Pythium insidiosum]|nr:hypothetical protein PINS_up001635 [Pythium insidiosum]